MPGPQLDQTAMGGGKEFQANLKDALANKSGVNARNSMYVPEGSAQVSIQQPRKGFFGFKKGGVVPGKGSRDSVKAKLTPGEVVIPKGRAKKDMKPRAYKALKPRKGPMGLMEG